MAKHPRHTVLIVVMTAVVYAAVIGFGLHLIKKPDRGRTSESEALRTEGANIFEQTPIYAPQLTGNDLSCGSCHEGGGRQPTAAPMTGVVSRFPQFSQRAGRTITLRDRVRECFVRSENGSPPSDDSPAMLALLAYIKQVSDLPNRDSFVGLPKLPMMVGDASAGASIYASQCAGCHGEHGEGSGREWPPLWGARSFNDGAGMYKIPNLAAFIRYNMPQNRKGILSPQQAFDVATYIHTQQRPILNPAYAKF